MMCKYLQKYSVEPCKWSVASCMARNCHYVPSIAELNDYCHGVGHEDCPFFLCQEASGEECRASASKYYNCAA